MLLNGLSIIIAGAVIGINLSAISDSLLEISHNINILATSIREHK